MPEARAEKMTTLTVEDGASSRKKELDPGNASAQLTLRSSVRLSGQGLHSGSATHVAVRPAPADTGIVFSDGKHMIQGLVANVVDTSRGTTIGFNGTRVRTIEHLMAALRGKGVDNAVVEIDGEEMPAMDGSALPYVEAIDSAGLVELTAQRRTVSLTEPVCVRQNGSFILAVPAQELRITYVMNYNHPMIGSQSATYVFRETDFGEEIAPARTFVL